MTIKNENLINRTNIITPKGISLTKNTTKNYSYVLLTRLERQGKLKKIKKGKYTSSTNIYAIATNIITPSYLSFWSGIAYKGKTEQLLNTIFIACTKKVRDLEFENYKIKFIKLSKNKFFGFYKEISGNEEIFVASNEKLLLDCLLYKRYSGGLDEIIKFFEKTEFNLDNLKEYLKRINNKSLIKKVSFLFKKYKKQKINLD
jgi:predicted transcriptional regulator of viral defense system